MEMKYNIGDKVISLELDYFDNYYHFGKCIIENTVLCANSEFFSTHYKEIPSFIAGMDQWGYNHQKTGTQLYGNKRWYHKEKDALWIQELIQQAVDKYDKFTAENDVKRIKQLENKIEAYKAEIEEIKKGNGSWKSGFSTRNNKEYKEKILKEISKSFDTNFLR